MPNSREVLSPFPGVNWAKNTYHPATGDFGSHKLGVVRIAIGQRLYSLQETQTLSPVLTERTIDGSEDRTRIYLGFLGSTPSIRIYATAEQPFALEDPDRMNQAAAYAIELSELQTSYQVFLRIQRIGIAYLQSLKLVLPESDKNALENIAVLEDAVGKYSRRDYISEFLQFADSMDEIGIAEMHIAEPGDTVTNGTSFTPDHIRKTYGPKEKVA